MPRFDFTKEYVLQNTRVRLESLTDSHRAELKDLAREPEIWTYFLGRSDGSRDFDHYFNDTIASRRDEKEYPFAVFDKQLGKYAGCTRFFDYDKDLNIVRLGYSWYGKEFRGTRLNKNCKYLMFEFAFEKLGVERVGLGAHAENQVSIAAMQGVGCTPEGRVRNAFPSIHGEGRADAVLLSVLREEWLGAVKNELREKL